jgi:hypothetical protein
MAELLPPQQPQDDRKQQEITAPNLLQTGQHICPACEDELMEAKASVLKTAGRAVVWTPLVITLLSFVDAMVRHVAWAPDERILGTALVGGAAILAFGFPTKEGTLGEILKDRLLDMIKKREEDE